MQMLWIATLLALQEPSRWDFKPGSWVEMSWGSLRSERRTVYREEVGGSRFRLAPFARGLKEVSRRPDEWQERPCMVVEYNGEHRTVRAWVVEGLSIPARDMAGAAVPADVVRAERVERFGTTEVTSTLEVLDLHAKVEIAGLTFDCVVERSMSVAEMADGSRCLRTRRRWLSAEVPGHIVRQDRQCTDRPDAVPHDYDTRDELKAFHVER